MSHIELRAGRKALFSISLSCFSTQLTRCAHGDDDHGGEAGWTLPGPAYGTSPASQEATVPFGAAVWPYPWVW